MSIRPFIHAIWFLCQFRALSIFAVCPILHLLNPSRTAHATPRHRFLLTYTLPSSLPHQLRHLRSQISGNLGLYSLLCEHHCPVLSLSSEGSTLNLHFQPRPASLALGDRHSRFAQSLHHNSHAKRRLIERTTKNAQTPRNILTKKSWITPFICLLLEQKNFLQRICSRTFKRLNLHKKPKPQNEIKPNSAPPPTTSTKNHQPWPPPQPSAPPT